MSDFKKSILISGPIGSGNTLMSFGRAYLDHERDEIEVFCGGANIFCDNSFMFHISSKTKCIIIDGLKEEEWIPFFWKFIGVPVDVDIIGVGRVEMNLRFIINTNQIISDELLNNQAFKRRFDIINNYSK